MGYTHYYYVRKSYDADVFAKIVEDFKKMLEIKVQSSEKVLAGSDGTGKAEITNKLISFNGIGDDAHEPFILEQSMSDKNYAFHKEIYEHQRGEKIEEDSLFFSFTKTARKPYDEQVQFALIIAKHHLGDKIKVSSDGSDAEWERARNLCNMIVGYGNEFTLDE